MPLIRETLFARILLLAYSLVIHLVVLLSLPWSLFRAWKTGKLSERFSERFGFLSRDWLSDVREKRPIWIHAVSVGESQMLGPLLKRLKKSYPDIPIVVSTGTVPGQRIAESHSQVVGTFYLPLDLGWSIRLLLSRLRPRLLVIMETEIWPNLIVQTARRNVPVVFLNGRISDRSFGGYRKARLFLRQVLRYPAGFGVQSATNRDRLIALGAPPEKVRITGNLKFESAKELLDEEVPFRRRDFGLREEDLVVIGGSTFPGEEALLLRVYQRLRETQPCLRLLLAPRHPQRFEEACKEIQASGEPVWRRSQGDFPGNPESTGESPVVLLDVMGELKKIYSFVDVVFIGKSMRLSPQGRGGQNPLEAAVWSKPIVSGPSMENFREVVEALRELEGISQIETEERLEEILGRLLRDPELREEKGRNAHQVIANSEGAADRCLELLQSTPRFHPDQG
jgi:3-deoxy-D-manno-octulosonic-acid transferase